MVALRLSRLCVRIGAAVLRGSGTAELPCRRMGDGGPRDRRADPARCRASGCWSWSAGRCRLRRSPTTAGRWSGSWMDGPAMSGLCGAGASALADDGGVHPAGRPPLTRHWRWPRECRPERACAHALDRWYGGSEEAFRNALAERAKRYLGTESTAGAANRAGAAAPAL